MYNLLASRPNEDLHQIVADYTPKAMTFWVGQETGNIYGFWKKITVSTNGS